MPPRGNSKAMIVSMAVVASVIAVLLHEGIGHGVIAWLRGDVPTQLTSNHLSDLHDNRLVSAGGTIVNLLAGTLFIWLAEDRSRSSKRAISFGSLQL